MAEVIAFRDAADFEAWLSEHVDQKADIWLRIAKKASDVPSLTDNEAVEIGLCYGWISGQRKALDEVYYLQKYVPRRPRSRWSQVNVRKVEALTAAGRVRPAAYESQKDATVPPDLAAALAASPRAAQAFGALKRTGEYAVILGVVTARTTRTRVAHLRTAIAALEAGTVGPDSHPANEEVE